MSEAVSYHTFNADRFRQRFDVVFDTAGALSLRQRSTMLKRGGVSLHVVPTAAKMIRCLLSARHHLVFGNPTPSALAGVAELADRGELFPMIGRVAPLSEAIQAIVQLGTKGLPKGKLVIVSD